MLNFGLLFSDSLECSVPFDMLDTSELNVVVVIADVIRLDGSILQKVRQSEDRSINIL